MDIIGFRNQLYKYLTVALNHRETETSKLPTSFLKTSMAAVEATFGLIIRVRNQRLEWYAIDYQGGDPSFITQHTTIHQQSMDFGTSFDAHVFQVVKKHGSLIRNTPSPVPPGHPPIDNLCAVYLNLVVDERLIEGVICLANRSGGFTESQIELIEGGRDLLALGISRTYIQPTSYRAIDLVVNPQSRIVNAYNPTELLRGDRSMIEIFGDEQYQSILDQKMKKVMGLIARAYVDDRWHYYYLHYIEYDADSQCHLITFEEIGPQMRIPYQALHNFYALAGGCNCICDLDRKRFLVLSDRWTEVTGYTKDELMSRPFIEFIHPDDREPTENVIVEMFGGAPAINFENRYIAKDGTEIWIRWHAIMMNDMAIAAGTIVTEFKDMIDRLDRLRQLAEGSNQAKNQFLSRASHEIRTPLNSISGFSQLIELNNVDQNPQVKWCCGKIKKASKHLMMIIDDILNISKIESGNITFSIEQMLISKVIDESVELVINQAEAKSVLIEIDRRFMNLAIQTDLQKMRQIMLNLLSNGVKYNKQYGSLRIFGDCHDGEIDLHFQDTGIGVPETDQKLLFEPFHRCANALEIEGVGLGLNFSQKLAEKMQSRLWYNSDYTNGSDFVITMPVELTESNRSIIENSTESTIDTIGQKQTSVLIYIEDNVDNYELIECLSQNYKMKLLTFIQGKLGLEVIKTQPPMVVFLDLNLPDIYGLDVLRVIRSTPGIDKLPVYVITADATSSTRDKAVVAGATDVIHKPVDLTEILSIFDRYFQKK